MRYEINMNELLMKYYSHGKMNIYIELKIDANPYHAKPYPVPRSHKSVFNKIVERFLQPGIMKKLKISEWVSPYVIQQKT